MTPIINNKTKANNSQNISTIHLTSLEACVVSYRLMTCNPDGEARDHSPAADWFTKK